MGFSKFFQKVSTHSRLKAAGFHGDGYINRTGVSTHSRLKAAGSDHWYDGYIFKVSTHSRLKAAGSFSLPPARCRRRFNTQPPEGGWKIAHTDTQRRFMFQHTAA